MIIKADFREDNIHSDSLFIANFIWLSFVYLLLGSLLLYAIVMLSLKVSYGAIFLLWFFGFVTNIIFGLSYMFVPGLMHSKYAAYDTIRAEFYVFNTGIIIFFISNILKYAIAEQLGLALIIIAIFINTINVLNMTLYQKRNKNKKSESN
ncbi:multipass membrane protein [Candidatus Mancarchaeum acidiphilum]|uniref:Multipass membrane protein n=1 Tax=Candidatus Mancarchaeum acidiphilum TaxID=1920749 RepID=A0A218NMB5_9ARCH|nr:hypothetical protein [Candidatus Mancarchaeum acidiphilum]ASI13603.1 multipass membrane protein [Candidatus Mancarchaeum acidiphilum]